MSDEPEFSLREKMIMYCAYVESGRLILSQTDAAIVLERYHAYKAELDRASPVKSDG